MATEQPACRTVEATINYVAPESFINRRFVAPGVAPLGWMIRTSGDVAKHQRQAKEGYTPSGRRPAAPDEVSARPRESIEFRTIAYFEGPQETSRPTVAEAATIHE